MTLDIPTPLRDELAALARSAAPREACGLLSIGYGGVRLHRAENAAQDGTWGFEVAPAELLHLLRLIDERAERLVGIFHSHPSGAALEPSARDREVARLWPGKTWVICNGRGEFWIGQP